MMMNILTKRTGVKKFVLFSCVVFLFCVLFTPDQALAYGLGSAGSLTMEGLVVGIAVIGIIFLVFLGLLLMSRVNELDSIEEDNKEQEAPRQPVTSNDIMNLSRQELNELIQKRQFLVKTK